jgi:hypothetical protein
MGVVRIAPWRASWGAFVSEEASTVSYADKLAAISSAFKNMLPDLQRFVEEIGEADGWVLTSLHRGTKYEIDALYAIVLKLEKGESINVPCASCGHNLSMFDLRQSNTMCEACCWYEQEYEEDYLESAK